jgi:hypothetical protein
MPVSTQRILIALSSSRSSTRKVVSCRLIGTFVTWA